MTPFRESAERRSAAEPYEIPPILAGCQTTQQRVADRSKLACFQAEFGETSLRHDECMRTVQPVGLALERKQQVDEGFALIEKGLRRNEVTCTTGSDTFRCERC